MANPVTPEKLADLKRKCAQVLAMTRQELLMNSRFAFTGGMMMRFDIVPTRDKRIRTACTDGTKIYFDIAFCASLTDKERTFVLAHEVWHNIFMHMTRKQTRMHELFNVATDMEINRLLVAEGLTPPKDLCFPKPEWKPDLNAEEMYELLLKDAKKMQQQSGQGSGKGSGSSDSQDNSDKSSGSNDVGNKDGKLKGQFDKHVYANEGMRSNEDTVTDKYGEVGEDPDFTPHVDHDVAEKIREAIVAEVQKAERHQGHLPAGVKRLIDEIRKPEINWKQILQQFVTQCYGGERVFGPFNRRHIYHGMYLPSMRDHKIKVGVIMDTSGSCAEDLPKFYAELKSLLTTFGKYECHTIQCDAEVQDYKLYDEANPLPMNINKYEFNGYGGSNFKPAFEFIRKKNIEVDVCICITDGEITFPTYRQPFPTLAILTHDSRGDMVPDWVQKTWFKNAA